MWFDLLDKTTAEGKAVVESASGMKDGIVAALNEYIARQKAAVKRMYKDREAMERAIAKKRDALAASRKEYVDAYNRLKNASVKSVKSTKDKDVQKQKELKDSLSAAMQQAHNAYTLALRALRAEEDMHFQECVPSLMDQLQAWHVSINGELSEAIAGYAELLKGRWEDLSQDYDPLQESASAGVNTIADIRAFIKTLEVTDYCPPEVRMFETVSTEGDDLSVNENTIKALGARLVSVRKSVQDETKRRDNLEKDMGGLEKLRKTYTENPAMGNPVDIEMKLVEMRREHRTISLQIVSDYAQLEFIQAKNQEHGDIITSALDTPVDTIMTLSPASRTHSQLTRFAGSTSSAKQTLSYMSSSSNPASPLTTRHEMTLTPSSPTPNRANSGVLDLSSGSQMNHGDKSSVIVDDDDDNFEADVIFEHVGPRPTSTRTLSTDSDSKRTRGSPSSSRAHSVSQLTISRPISTVTTANVSAPASPAVAGAKPTVAANKPKPSILGNKPTFRPPTYGSPAAKKPSSTRKSSVPTLEDVSGLPPLEDASGDDDPTIIEPEASAADSAVAAKNALQRLSLPETDLRAASDDQDSSYTALYDFSPTGPDEISLVAGEPLVVEDSSDPEWFCVRLANGTRGHVPALYVAPVSDPAAAGRPLPKASANAPAEATIAEVPSVPRVVAEFDYTARTDEELTIVAGDIMTVIGDAGEGWSHVEFNGRNGLVPTTYIVEIVE